MKLVTIILDNMKFSYLILILFLGSIKSLSSQTFVNIPQGDQVMNFAEISDNAGVALIGGLEIFKSTNDGLTWVELSNNFGTSLYGFQGVNAAIINANTYCLIVKSVFTNNYYVFKTVDGGTNWSNVLNASSLGTGVEFRDISYNGTSVVVTATNGICRSMDNGSTWTPVQLSTSGALSPAVQFNSISGTYYISEYGGNFSTSGTNGSTWSALDLSPYTGSNVSQMTNQDGQVLITKAGTSGTDFIRVNASDLITTDFFIDEALVYGNEICREAYYLSNGMILSHNGNKFYTIDPSTGSVYFHDFQFQGYSGSWSEIDQLALGSTYGLAVGGWGGVCRIDLSTPPDIFVPSTFEFEGTSFCPGDSILATPTHPFADSVEWYFDGQAVSTTTQLSYVLPTTTYGSHPIQLKTWYNGVVDSTSVNVSIAYPPSPHGIAYVVANEVCYGESMQILINPDNGPIYGSTYLEVLYGDNSMYGPQVLTSNNLYINTPAMTSQDTIRIVRSISGTCSTVYDTITIPIEVRADLSTIDVVYLDSVVCSGQSPQFHISNLQPGATYDLYSLSFLGTTVWSTNTTGNNLSDTVLFNTSSFNNLNSALTDDYGDVYVKFFADVSDSYGCSVDDVLLDSVRIQRPKASFLPQSVSVYRGDTVKLTNIYVTENRLWEQPQLPGTFVQQPTDTVPLIVPDTTGYYALSLTNTPLPGCTDQMQYIMHYCDSLPYLSDPSCSVEGGSNGRNFKFSKMDQFGNSYVCLYDYSYSFGSAVFFVFSKYDPEGQLVWSIKAPKSGSLVKGAMIEDVSFDENGDLYVAMWAQASNYSSPWISTSFQHNHICKLLKLDKDDASIIWSKDLSQFPIGLYETSWRVTSTTVSDDKVYFSVVKSDQMILAATDLDGNFISGSLGTMYGYPGFIILSGPQAQYVYGPKLATLSDGRIVGVNHYNTSHIYSSQYPQLSGYGAGGLMAFYYAIGVGYENVTQLAQTGHVLGSGIQQIDPRPTLFDIDANDNIITAFGWNDGAVEVLDSIMEQPTGVSVFKVDANFDPVWITTGTHSVLEDLKVAKSTDQVYLSGRVRANYSFGHDETHLMGGEYAYLESTFDHVPSSYELFGDLYFNDTVTYVAQFDGSGIPVNSRHYKTITNYTYGAITVNPCGDLHVFVTNKSMPGGAAQVQIGNQVHTVDSLLVFSYINNCSPGQCSYANFADSMGYCIGDSVIEIPITSFFNLDSIQYSISDGTNLLASGYVPYNGNNTEIAVPNAVNGSFNLIINTPVTDTVHYEPLNQMSTFNFPDSLCYGQNIVISGTPTSNYYSWIDGALSGATVTLSDFYYSSGNNAFDVQVTDPNGCIQTDTLNVVVLGPTSSGLQATYDVPCLNSIEIPYNDAGFSSAQWILGGTEVPNYFDEGVLSYGYNNVQVLLTDTSGCEYDEWIAINYCLNAGLADHNEAINASIMPNPSDGNFTVQFSENLEEAFVEIYGADGRTIQEVSINNRSSIVFDLKLAAGTYFVKVRSGENRWIERISIVNN